MSGPWRIVKLEANGGFMGDSYTVTAEAPPEVVPAVWTHEGCETCGGSGQEFVGSIDYDWQPCPDGRLVPWKGEET